MTTKEAEKILWDYSYNITHVGEESEAIQTILFNTLNWEELKEIVMSVECKGNEAWFIKGEILGLIIKKMCEKRK